MASRNKPFFEIVGIKMNILVAMVNKNAFTSLVGEAN